jgi:hypothetical protein
MTEVTSRQNWISIVVMFVAISICFAAIGYFLLMQQLVLLIGAGIIGILVYTVILNELMLQETYQFLPVKRIYRCVNCTCIPVSRRQANKDLRPVQFFLRTNKLYFSSISMFYQVAKMPFQGGEIMQFKWNDEGPTSQTAFAWWVSNGDFIYAPSLIQAEVKRQKVMQTQKVKAVPKDQKGQTMNLFVPISFVLITVGLVTLYFVTNTHLLFPVIFAIPSILIAEITLVGIIKELYFRHTHKQLIVNEFRIAFRSDYHDMLTSMFETKKRAKESLKNVGIKVRGYKLYLPKGIEYTYKKVIDFKDESYLIFSLKTPTGELPLGYLKVEKPNPLLVPKARERKVLIYFKDTVANAA